MLTKKDKKKRYNRLYKKGQGHQFGWGAATETAIQGDMGGAVGGLVGAASAGINAGMQNAELVGVEEAQADIDARKNFTSTASTNNDLLAEMASATNTKADFDFKDFMQDGKTLAMNTINATMQGAASGASAGPWGAVAGAAAGLLGGVGGIIGGRVKAGVEAAKKKEAARRANMAQAQALTAKAGALDQAADARSLAAYYADGGMINPFPSSEFGSPVTEFNAGGSHEENPYDGIPQGVAPDGLPNLVEEGEVKYDNYIFSDRLMLSKEDKKKYKFLKGKTYADAAKKIKKDLGIDERPNDLIAKTDLEEQLNLLSMLQEEKRAKKGLKGENRMMYAKGGHLFEVGGETDEMGEIEDGISDEFRDGNYIPLSITKPTEYTRNPLLPNPKSKSKSFDWSSLLEATPTIASSLAGLVQSFQGHDRSIANKLYSYEPERSYTKAPQVTTPKVNISKYKIDEEQAARENDAMVLATMRAARESSTNPLAVMNQINAASYAGQIASGKARAEAKKANFEREMVGNQFNLGIDQLQGNFDLAADKLNAAERDAYNTLKYKALATGASADIRSKESYEEALGKTWTSAAENINTLAHDKIYDKMVQEYLKNKTAALGGPLSIQKSKNKIRGKKRNRLV